MTDRTLHGLALLALLALAGCNDPEATAAVEPAPDATGWRLSSGKAPSKAEFTALAATCAAKGRVTDSCLIELGLKRVP